MALKIGGRKEGVVSDDNKNNDEDAFQDVVQLIFFSQKK